MVNVVKIKLECVCHVNSDIVDDVGEWMADTMLKETFDGEDILEWKYCGYEIIC